MQNEKHLGKRGGGRSLVFLALGFRKNQRVGRDQNLNFSNVVVAIVEVSTESL